MASSIAYLLHVGTDGYNEPRYRPDLHAIAAYPRTAIPRYLFCAWSSHSRGYNGSPKFICAGRHAMTPPLPIPQSSNFINDTYNHLRSARKIRKHRAFENPYISFSNPLLLVLAWARRKLESHEASMTIAVIDTTKVTSPAILPASFLVSIVNACQEKNRAPLIADGYDEEYVAYDTLEVTTASRGIRIFGFVDLLQQTQLRSFLRTLDEVNLDRHWHAQLENLRSTVYESHRPLTAEQQKILVEIALRFPTNFVLPILVKLLGMCGLQTDTDALIRDTIMSNTAEFKCDVASYEDFLPKTLNELAPLRIPELVEEYTLIEYMHTTFANQQIARALRLASLKGGVQRISVLLEHYKARNPAKAATNRFLRAYLVQLQDKVAGFDNKAYSRLQDGGIKDCDNDIQEWEVELKESVLIDVASQIGGNAFATPLLGSKRGTEGEDGTDESAAKRIKL